MGFHGFTHEDIAWGRNEADYDKARINEGATAAELAGVTARFDVSMYPGVGQQEKKEAISLVYEQALAQAAAALELGATEDVRDYRSVAAMARQTLDIMSFSNEIHEASDEEEQVFKRLLKD
jgi:hypothetical protein